MQSRILQSVNQKKIRILRALVSAADDCNAAPENEQDVISLARQYINPNWEITDADIIQVTRSVVLMELLDAAGKPFNAN